MIVLVEGPDNVGKGTQITNIKKWIEKNRGPVHVLHYSNIKGTPDSGFYSCEHFMDGKEKRLLTDNEKIKLASVHLYEEMFNIMKYACENEINLILDRAHIGEIVYSPMYRGYNGEYVYTMEHNYCCSLDLDSFAKAGFNGIAKQCVLPTWYDTKLILYVDKAENLIAREDGNSFSIDLEKKRLEIESFKQAFFGSCLRKEMIDIQFKTKEEVWDHTMKFLSEKPVMTKEFFEEYFE